MNKSKHKDVREKLVANFARLSASWGFKEGHGKIYGTLLLAKEPWSMKEISKQTGYSISAVSTYLDILERLRLVSKLKKDGVYIYLAEADFVKFYRRAMQEMIDEDLKPLRSLIDTEINDLAASKDADDKHLLKILKDLRKHGIAAEKYLETLMEVNPYGLSNRRFRY